MKTHRSYAGLTLTIAIAAAALAACAEGPAAPHAEPAFSQHKPAAAPVTFSFSKDFNAAASSETLLVWHGTVEHEGATGVLVSSIDLTQPGTRSAGQTLHATVRWEVSGDIAFVIETAGVINFRTGLVRTNGRVLSGLHAGAAVHQQGQLDGLDASGFLRVNPATAP